MMYSFFRVFLEGKGKQVLLFAFFKRTGDCPNWVLKSYIDWLKTLFCFLAFSAEDYVSLFSLVSMAR